MVDVVDKKTRSRMMAGIRSTDTKPEILIRRALHRLGYRYRLGSKVGRIKPDVVLRNYRVVVFAHGCYWHQHEGCKLAYSDRQYSEKWKRKFTENRQRDQRVLGYLTDEGWRVAVIWECATRKEQVFEAVIMQLDKWIQTINGQYFESDYRQV